MGSVFEFAAQLCNGNPEFKRNAGDKERIAKPSIKTRASLVALPDQVTDLREQHRSERRNPIGLQRAPLAAQDDGKRFASFFACLMFVLPAACAPASGRGRVAGFAGPTGI